MLQVVITAYATTDDVAGTMTEPQGQAAGLMIEAEGRPRWLACWWSWGVHAGVVSPDVKGPGRGEEGVLLFLDLSTGTGTATGSRRLGGSALAQALGKAVDGEGPDMRDPQELATRLKAVQVMLLMQAVGGSRDRR